MNNTYLWLQGGLGNQLFQLNMGLNLSRKRSQNLKIILNSYFRDKLRDFELEPILESAQKASFFESIIYGRPYSRSGNLKSSVGFGTLKVDTASSDLGPEKSLLVGFFQDQESIKDGTGELCDLLRNIELSDKALKLKNEIAGRPVLHVRRGDYVSLQSSLDTFGTLDVPY